jgi:hypothetical protein
MGCGCKGNKTKVIPTQKPAAKPRVTVVTKK